MLPRFGPAGDIAVPELRKILAHDPDSSVRLAAVRAIGQLPPVSDESVTSIIKALQSTDPHLIVSAAEILRTHPSGRGQELIVLALANAIDRSDQWTGATGEASRMLESYGPSAEAAVPALLRALERTGEWPDSNIYNALEKIATKHSEVIIAKSAGNLPTHRAALDAVLQIIRSR